MERYQFMLMKNGLTKTLTRKRKLFAAAVAVVVCAASLYMQVFSQSQSAVRASEPITLPDGYRDWRLISVAHEAGNLNDIRAILGNDKAVDAYRRGDKSFPDGAIIARLAWEYTSSKENDAAFGQQQSYVAGSPTNVQLMVKDKQRFGTTGGWRFAQFTNGKAAPAKTLQGCFSCHAPAKQSDYLFTKYAR